MRVLILEDDGTIVDDIHVTDSDFTQIRNGAAFWTSPTVEMRKRIFEALVQAHQHPPMKQSLTPALTSLFGESPLAFLRETTAKGYNDFKAKESNVVDITTRRSTK